MKFCTFLVFERESPINALFVCLFNWFVYVWNLFVIVWNVFVFDWFVYLMIQPGWFYLFAAIKGLVWLFVFVWFVFFYVFVFVIHVFVIVWFVYLMIQPGWFDLFAAIKGIVWFVPFNQGFSQQQLDWTCTLHKSRNKVKQIPSELSQFFCNVFSSSERNVSLKSLLPSIAKTILLQLIRALIYSTLPLL